MRRMSEAVADFVLFGSTPLARLLAGLLAAEHKRTVIFVGESQAAYHLPRGTDLSLAPISRPETWQMLRDGVGETTRLLSRIGGRGSWSRTDPILFADGEAGKEAIAHMRQMAISFGIAAERATPSLLGAGRTGTLFRDAVRLHRPVLEPRLDAWLEQVGVRRVSPQSVEIAADGGAMLDVGEDHPLAARQTILADDASILAHLAELPGLLHRQTMSSILTRPTHPIAAPVMVHVDAAMTLEQGKGGGVSAWGPGDLAEFSSRLHQLLGANRRVEQAGQTSYQSVSTGDGAPAFGRLGGSGADVIAGLGALGVYFAPSLARWLSGASRSEEELWFAARLVEREAASSTVAEFAPQHDAGSAQ